MPIARSHPPATANPAAGPRHGAGHHDRLYSYPGLFGVADNDGYGLKVFAFLKLIGLPFTHQHIFDASAAPRGQLPYIVDDGERIGDSDTIIEHLTRKYRLTIDDGLTRWTAHKAPPPLGIEPPNLAARRVDRPDSSGIKTLCLIGSRRCRRGDEFDEGLGGRIVFGL